MIEQKIHNGTRWSLIIISSLIILTAVFLVGLFWGQKNTENAYQQGYDAGWSTARLAVEESGVFPPEIEEINSLSGEIMDINTKNQSFTIMADAVSNNPLEETGPMIRTIQINEAAVITKNTPKDFDEFFKEQEAYDRQLATLSPEETPPEAPSPYDTEEIGFEDLEAGQTVTVHSSENIRIADLIVAERIDIYIEVEAEE
jgi:hypothetical protein